MVSQSEISVNHTPYDVDSDTGPTTRLVWLDSKVTGGVHDVMPSYDGNDKNE